MASPVKSISYCKRFLGDFFNGEDFVALIAGVYYSTSPFAKLV